MPPVEVTSTPAALTIPFIYSHTGIFVNALHLGPVFQTCKLRGLRILLTGVPGGRSCPKLADERPSDRRNLLNGLKRTRANRNRGWLLLCCFCPSTSTTAKVSRYPWQRWGWRDRVKQRGPTLTKKPIWTSMTGGSSVLPPKSCTQSPKAAWAPHLVRSTRAWPRGNCHCGGALPRENPPANSSYRLSRRHCSPCELALSNQWTFGRVHAPASQSHPPGRWHSRRRKCGCPPLRRRSGRWCLSETCPSARPGQRRLQG